MRYLEEFRNPEAALCLAREISDTVTRPWSVMEVCGGQTHSILRNGIDTMLPGCVRLIHGPGCPVCVTPAGLIDKAAAVASMEGVTLCTFGDMLRVPGGRTDLQAARAAGADVRMVYSPIDAVRLAAAEPSREVVFFAVGFETTVPSTATAILQAARLGLCNFSMINAHVRVPPVLHSVLSRPSCGVNGILAAGHVCAVTGYEEYEPIASAYSVPMVVTGFEPVDILQGILMCLRQLESGSCEVENQYARVVRRSGNLQALELISTVFEPADREWRGLGLIPGGGYAFRNEFNGFDAEGRFDTGEPGAGEPEPGACMSARVLTGEILPRECPGFGTECTPEHPLGAPMVSSEGACAAYLRYRGGREQES